MGGTGRDRSRAVLLALTLLVPPTPLEASGGVEVTFEEQGAGHVLVGSFTAPVPPPVAWSVLTDYDRLAGFVSSLKESRTESRGAGAVRVRQRGVGRAGIFRKEIAVTLEINERPPWRIDFKDVSGESFSSYQGAWAIGPDDAGTVVRYELRATARGTSLPGALGRRVTRSNVSRLLEDVREEMVRRGTPRLGD